MCSWFPVYGAGTKDVLPQLLMRWFSFPSFHFCWKFLGGVSPCSSLQLMAGCTSKPQEYLQGWDKLGSTQIWGGCCREVWCLLPSVSSILCLLPSKFLLLHLLRAGLPERVRRVTAQHSGERVSTGKQGQTHVPEAAAERQ